MSASVAVAWPELSGRSNLRAGVFLPPTLLLRLKAAVPLATVLLRALLAEGTSSSLRRVDSSPFV